MPQTIGWQAALPDILHAATATRRFPPFDEKARAREVATRVSEAKRFPWWPAVAAVVAVLLPHGWILTLAALLLFGGLIHQAMQRSAALGIELNRETERLRAHHRAQAARLEAAVAAANAGDGAALGSLLARWNTLRPDSIKRFRIELSTRRTITDARECLSSVWELRGEAIRRGDVPAGIPRIGRGGRTVSDKRKAAEIDEDLAELNAAAVLSVLLALFSGSSKPVPIVVRLVLPKPPGGELVPWVTLSRLIDRVTLERARGSVTSAVETIRRLGGDVGRWRNQRVTAAAEPVGDAFRVSAISDGMDYRLDGTPLALQEPIETLSEGAAFGTVQLPPRGAPIILMADRHAPLTAPPILASMPPGLTTPVPPLRVIEEHAQDPYGSRATSISFGEAVTQRPEPMAGGAIPHPPLQLGASVGLSSAIPTPLNVNGEFSSVARRFVAYRGEPVATFLAYQSDPTYAQMARGQLKYYFAWRHAVRNGETPRTDLSYILVHVYELLHVIGAETPVDACLQLERLWQRYRETFPKLDHYMVDWISDLYATEVGTDTALDFVERAVALGAMTGPDDLFIATDKQWASGAYGEMSNDSLALLVGDPRLGKNRFYVEHNVGPTGQGWIDRAYREALSVTDRFCHGQHGRTPRDQMIASGGFRTITRQAFQGAVYDWKRKTVTLNVPDLSDTAPAVQAYRCAVRYAENLLRKERNFPAKLRGVTVDAGLARALDAHFATFLRATRPRARVTIDLSKAQNLARESADVRARLLKGVEVAEDVGPLPIAARPSPDMSRTTSTGRTKSGEPVADGDIPAEHIAAGLLTDLAAVHDVLSSLTGPARALVEALAARGWESAENDPDLNAATAGALIGPLVDEINERAVRVLGDVLLVTEENTLVVQEDFRDEVHWVLNGSLDGFSDRRGLPAPANALPVSPSGRVPTAADQPDTDGFGPIELRVLAIIAVGGPGVPASVSKAAREQATTPLLLVDRINEAALASPYGDILVDAGASPLVLLEDAREYVVALLDRVRSILQSPPAYPDTEESEPAT